MQSVSNPSISSTYFVVIFGPPASGKTTIAHLLQTSILNTIHSPKQQPICGLISGDCCEEFLRNHSAQELDNILLSPEGWTELNSYRLKRALFNPELWKKSRDFIFSRLKLWLNQWKILIFEDDLLLRSQRKQLRQLVEYTEVKYVEICCAISLEECLQNLKLRSNSSHEEENIEFVKTKQCYEKFQTEQNPYSITLSKDFCISWLKVQTYAKQVVTDHPELKQKLPASAENAAKDQVETQIRAYISEIMRNAEMKGHYFPGKPAKQIAFELSRVKKNYKDKNKTLEGFKEFLLNETRLKIQQLAKKY